MVGLASNAQAQTASANFQVTATVVNRCTISAANLAFGDYHPTSSAPLNAQSDLTVSCTRGHTAWIGLSDGLHYSGARRMQNAAGTVLPSPGCCSASVRQAEDDATGTMRGSRNRDPSNR